MKYINYLFIFVAGVLGGVIAKLINDLFLYYPEETNGDSLYYLMFTGFLVAGIILFLMYINKIGLLQRFSLLKLTLTLIITLAILYVTENDSVVILFLSLVLGACIYIGIALSSYFSKFFSKFTAKVFGSVLGGFMGGIFSSIVLILRVNFSLDDGYFILIIFLLTTFGGILGLILGAFLEISGEGYFDTNDFPIFRRNHILLINLLSVGLIFIIISFGYWETLDLNGKNLSDKLNESDVFTCFNLEYKNEISKNTYPKSEVIRYLENVPKDIDTVATLYLISDEEKWGNEFKQKLLQEASNNKFIGISNSVKAWQYEVMVRAYYYSLVTEKNPNLFNKSENDLTLNWFKRINENAYKLTWVDYLYAFYFKKMPDGFYENQEIGAGMLSALTEVLQNEYPQLADKNKEYLEKMGVGWKGNFRNPDDGITYHHTIWIKNAFVMAKSGVQEDYLLGNNSLFSFEWILRQYPPNGLNPSYNVPAEYLPLDVMVLGAYLFNNSEYQWLSEKMLDREIARYRGKDYIIGLNYWNTSINSKKPLVGSCYIKGTTGIAQKPGPLQPDKIAFRDGWEEDSLYALLNLRFSGWHSYKATNSIISLMYGEPFIVEELPSKSYKWLPKGKAEYRDKKIDRLELNTFQLESSGLEKIVYKLTGFGSPWSQDPPKFAQVILFNSTPFFDVSKTRISDWHGWMHDRAVVLIKGEYIIVFDYARGDKAKKTALTWHLTGNTTFADQYLKLSQNNYSLLVYYPTLSEEYQTKIINTENTYIPAGKIHESNNTILILSENKQKMGFATLFYPYKSEIPNVNLIEVLNSKAESAHPSATGLEISSSNETSIVGSRFEPGTYRYNNIKTDAEIFLVKKKSEHIDISFENANMFEIKSYIKPQYLMLNGAYLNKSNWNYSNNTIVIYNLHQGYLQIKI